MSSNLSPPSLSQTWLDEFDLIRCYFDKEVPESIARLVNNAHFAALLTDFVAQTQPQVNASDQVKTLLAQLARLESVDALQQFVNVIASPIVEKSVSQLTLSGLENLPKNQSYLFISNHRDILMDPLLLNLLLFQHQFGTAHCAIGDNLLQSPIALEFACLNKCFRVQRSLKSPKAMLKAMKLQSYYIRHLRFNRQENLWIAQKEGRSKDNQDKTNPALIKMLGLGRPKEMTLGEYVQQLNIVPVCFSYEWDPCDIDKATELVVTEAQGHYQKEDIEDFTSVKKGLLQSKGRVHIHFDDSLLNGQIAGMNHTEIAVTIDRLIEHNYKRFPVNFAAARALNQDIDSALNASGFSGAEIDDAKSALDARLQGCDEAVIDRVYRGYAASLISLNLMRQEHAL